MPCTHHAPPAARCFISSTTRQPLGAHGHYAPPTACCIIPTQHYNRWEHKRLERCSWSMTRTGGAGCSRGPTAGSEPLVGRRYSTIGVVEDIFEITKLLLVPVLVPPCLPSATARVTFQFDSTAVAAAAPAAAAARREVAADSICRSFKTAERNASARWRGQSRAQQQNTARIIAAVDPKLQK